MRRTYSLIASLAASAALAGCGGGSDGDTSATTAQPPKPGNHGEIAQIVMQNNAFTPALMIIHTGTELVWTNDDDVEHDVKSTSGETFASKRLGKGGSFSFRPSKTGAIDYVCTIHPRMKARIQIEEPS